MEHQPSATSLDSNKRFAKAFGLILATGVGIRLLFLLLAGDLDLHADESSYAYLAMSWNRFGVYLGSDMFLWPPGHTAFLAFWVGLFGEGGIFAAKLCQVLLSAVIGSMIMLLAKRAFSPKAGLVAGGIWAVYVPLIGYTHYIWPESLFLAVFLPAVYLFLRILDRPPATGRALLMPVGLGLLLGLCMLIKESGLLLTILFCGAMLLLMKSVPLSRRVWTSATVLLTVIAVILPWAQRNQEVYGHTVWSGATLGRNLFWGANGKYKNFDYPKVDYKEIYKADDWVYANLIQAPKGSQWRVSKAANTIERDAENVDLAMDFIKANPGYVLRTRIKKFADWVTPLSFFVRHHFMGYYQGFVAGDGVRPFLILLSVLLTMLVFAAALPGFLLSLSDWNARTALGLGILAFLATMPLVAMSRYRLPVEPLLIVLAAGSLTSVNRPWLKRKWLLAVVLLGLAVLGSLWLINSKEILHVLVEVL